jgi:hypothetical protein
MAHTARKARSPERPAWLDMALKSPSLVPQRLEVLQELRALTDKFCDQFVDDDYKRRCHDLAVAVCESKLPVQQGKRAAWACGVACAAAEMGKQSRPLDLSPEEIAKAFGVAPKTLKAKSAAIQDALHKLFPRPPRAESAPPEGLILQFKVTLLGADPPIWRRIQVLPSTLGDLHLAIQAAMGWDDSHLFEFIIGRRRFTDLGPEGSPWDDDVEDAFATPLWDFIPENKRKKLQFRYVYDFGDEWEHEVLLEGRLEAEPKQRYPLCLEGEGACPPEDCGGLWGYYDLLEARNDPKSEQHDYYQEWLGEFDPLAFEAAAATKRMHSWR